METGALPRWVSRAGVLLACAWAGAVGVWAGGPLGVPVGHDVALWADGALDARWGQVVAVPPLYPRLCALLGGEVGLVVAGRAVSVAAATLLPALVWFLSRRAGASPVAGLVAAWFVALSPDLLASSVMFGPDALSALVFTAWLGALLVPAAPGLVAVTTALAVMAREPALPLVVVLAPALVLAGRRPEALAVVAGGVLSGLGGLRVPSSVVEAFPSIHKFAPLFRDAAGQGTGDYLLDVTAAVSGPLPGVETAIRTAYAGRVADLGLAGRVLFNAAHGLVAHADLWAWAMLALVATWRRRERWVVVAALLPLAGTLLAWSQRRHFLPFLGLEAIALAWLVDRVARARGVLLGAAVATALVLPGALSWARTRAASDEAVVRLARAVRAHSRWDDFLVLGAGARVDPVLLATAERPVAPRGAVDGALRWRVVAVGATPGAGWEEVHPGVFVYQPAAAGRDCRRGTVAGVVGFGLVPGDNGRLARVVAKECGAE